MRHLAFVSIFLFLSLSAVGQIRISGKITDKQTSQPIKGASISILNSKDSTTLKAPSDEVGNYTFNNLEQGTYVININYMGYKQDMRKIILGSTAATVNFQMESSEIILDEIEITAETVALKGDTMEFNANKYATAKNSDADELIRQIPGVEIDEDGNVNAHGEVVKKIIVDGKEFFSTDPKIALKSLPADIIDKVQIIDDKSEQAKFSGFDDGKRDKVINIVTKPNRKRGYFGKANGSLGNDEKYATNININGFQNDKRYSLTAMANNTNETNFGEQGRGGNRGGNSNVERGLSKTYAVATSVNNSYLNQKMQVSADYNFNSTNTNTFTNSLTNYILGSRANQLRKQTQNSDNGSVSHNAGARLHWDIDSTQRIDFVPQLSYTTNDRTNFNISTTLNQLQDTINTSDRRNRNNSNNFNISGALTYMVRLNKPGRTLSVNLNGNHSSNNSEGRTYALNQYYKDALLNRIDTNNNQNISEGYGNGINGRLTFTENISKFSRLQANYSYRNTANYSDRKTFEFLEETGQLGQLNERLSNEFRNDFDFHSGGISYLFSKKDSLTFQIGANYQYASRKNDKTFPKNVITTSGFRSFLPEMNITYHISKEKRLELKYNTATNAPSINQLQDFIDNQNALRIQNGNPDLNQEYKHNISFQFRDIKKSTGRSFNSSLNFEYIQDKIVNSILLTDTAVQITDEIILGAGGQYIRPENVNGAYSVRMTNSLGLPIKKWKLNLNLNNNLFFNNNYSILNKDLLNSRSYGIRQRVGVSSNFGRKTVIGLSYNGNLTFTENPSLQVKKYNVYNHTINNNASVDFWKGMFVTSNINYMLNGGVQNTSGVQTVIWNASIGKRFFQKENAELSLKAFDIFNKAKNVNRRIDEFSVSDVQSNTLTRYFLLSFTYHLRKFGGQESKGSRGPSNSRGERGRGRGNR
ncbi:outer membrane beta-barrel protein [Sphingobacterium spiritivorum]|uniref:outer membrane beta-barrel protein n=1 Tax=Sphingobacterium spiritivorum TaxID=258 RepID=UPI003DA277DD